MNDPAVYFMLLIIMAMGVVILGLVINKLTNPAPPKPPVRRTRAARLCAKHLLQRPSPKITVLVKEADCQDCKKGIV